MEMNKEIRLYTPGPVTVPHRVRAAAALPMIHHRSPEFHAVYASCVENLRWLLQTEQDVLLAHTSGRGAMEACVTNLLCRGDAIASVVNGNFGTMFANIAKAYGIETHPVLADWEKPFAGDEAAAELASVLKANPHIRAVTICHNDTANSVENDIRLAARVAHEHGALVFVDGVSSVGCTPLDFDAWDIDALATASQKGLMSPAGVSFVVLGERAWAAAERSDLPKYFTNFKDIRKKFHEKAGAPETPGSTPVTQVRCVAEALAMLREEGRDEVFARHARLSAAIRNSLKAMGLQIGPANAASPSRSVTTFLLPSGVTGAAVRSGLLDGFGIRIAGGLGQYKETTLRIGHMGYFFNIDALCVVSALETVLFRLGVLPRTGEGIAACMRSM